MQMRALVLLTTASGLDQHFSVIHLPGLHGASSFVRACEAFSHANAFPMQTLFMQTLLVVAQHSARRHFKVVSRLSVILDEA
jgi:hypothetical protein